MCSGQHGIWQCEKFKQLSVPEQKKRATDKALCFKCLGTGHYARVCPKKHFRCKVPSCGKEHHTLLHVAEKMCEGKELPAGANNAEGKVVAATGAEESRVCLRVIAVKVRSKNGIETVETYALLDSGSEVTICSERLARSLKARGKKTSFNLTGITGSQNIDSQLIDIAVGSMDGTTIIELDGVRTVKDIPISSQCIPKRQDLDKWPHLQNVDLHEVDKDEVLVIIGLKEHPQLFLPLEYNAGEAGEPIRVRYGLGWTIMGSVGCVKEGLDCLVNLLVSSTSVIPFEQGEKFLSANVKTVNDVQSRSSIAQIRENVVEFSRPIEERASLTDFEDHALKQKIEGLWKTDFGDTLDDGKFFREGNGHYQVALPWRSYPRHLHGNRELAVKRCELLKRRLLKGSDLATKYKAVMTDYMEKRHAERVPDEERKVLDKPVWYLPHHPVTHSLKPEKVRVVYDCAAKYNLTSLNHELLQGPDETNRLVGVICRSCGRHRIDVQPGDRGPQGSRRPTISLVARWWSI